MTNDNEEYLISKAPFGYAYHKIILDEDGKPVDYEFIHVNPVFEKLTGLKATNILNHSISKVVPGIIKDKFDWISYYGEIALNGGEKEFEQFSEYLNRWYSVLVYSPHLHYFVTIFTDITERKQVERRQSLTNEILGILSSNLNLKDMIGGVLNVIQKDTKFSAIGIRLKKDDDYPYFVHRGFSEDFLLTENSLLVRDMNGGICRDAKGNVMLECTCGLVISGKADKSSSLFTKAGSFWTNDSVPLLNLSPDEDPRLHPRNTCIHKGFASFALIPIMKNENIVGLLQLNDKEKGAFTLELINFYEGIGLYIGTALMRKQAEQEIKLKNEQLEKLNAEKDKFFSIIAHDLRSPFNSFLGFTHILAEKTETLSSQEIQDMAVLMKNSATNLYSLLENLLEWSKLQRGMISFAPAVFELGPAVSRSMTLVTESANKKELEIICRIPQDLHVFADEQMVETVIRNMVSNAIKFTNRGGKISIMAMPVDERFIEISVKDTGIGINHEMESKIFSLNGQTGRKGTNGEPSTGLGLIICKEFVEKQGGKIWLESEEGKGSTFFFSLPYKPAF